jgi:DNA-binding NarL/FixJ family response regulator
LPAPAELRATRFALEDDDYLVLSYPVATLRAPSELTRAERDVALAFALGESMRAIAASRASSVRTVANQMRSTYRKLRVRSRLELAARLAKG